LDGLTVNTHKDKELIIWEDFKERLGVSEFSRFTVNLTDFVQRVEGLELLEEPYSRTEIDEVVRKLPNDKSPGPDGFNNELLKKGWPVIKEDFYRLFNSFHDSNLCFRSISSSYITLIPKVDGARFVLEFRRISLLNTSAKLITKLLANRPQPVICSLIHKNQYGFIKSRTIDCLA
jgi:hypothetical protein